MEQFYDYKMTDERPVVQQAHEIQSLAKELEYFKCVLPDKFVAGGIIAKLPPSWNNFATSLNTRDRSFPLRISLVLLMLKRRREQRTHVLELLREVLVLTWYRRRTPSPTSTKTIEQNSGQRQV